MKAIELIALLQALPPDTEVKLWNGMAQDYQDVDPVIEQLTLSRDTFDSWLTQVAFERRRSASSFSEKEMEALRLQYDLRVEFADLHAGNLSQGYEHKRVAALHALPSGKRTFDRSGTIEY